jgi:hypothetical protein
MIKFLYFNHKFYLFSIISKMHPILEIALGVALGMTVFIVIIWVIGMGVYVCCNKNDCIASCKKVKNFKANKKQKIYVPKKEDESTAETIKSSDSN